MMKKLVIASFAVLLSVGATQVNAQSVTGGIKAEANMSNFILSDLDGFKNPMRVGASVGGFLKWDISQHFALQPELLFHFKATKLEDKATKNHSSYEYWGMEIPIYAVAQTQIGSGRGYIGLGPYVGVGFSSRAYPGGNLYSQDMTQRWDFGAGLMVGYEFSNRMSLNAGYKIGFIDALDYYKDDATALPQTVSLGLGYRF